jgi:hypothetical protein
LVDRATSARKGTLLEERMRGEVAEEGGYLDEYSDPEWNDFETIVKPALRLLSASGLSEVSGLEVTIVKEFGQTARREAEFLGRD